MTTRDIVAAVLAAYAVGDVDGALAHCADHVCYKNNSSPNMGMWEFDCHGVDAFREALGQINAEFEMELYYDDLFEASKTKTKSSEEVSTFNTVIFIFILICLFAVVSSVGNNEN